MIVFVGSVFSPYYRWARGRGPTDPTRHCCFHATLYGPRGRWAMTERGGTALARDRASIAIGPSSMRWDGHAVEIAIDERCAPWPSRLRGRLRLHPGAFTARAFALDAAARHRWWPMAPRARIEVALDDPALSWTGTAYFDTNDGDAPLERDFVEWDWARAPAGAGAAILYNAMRRDGTGQAIAIRVAPDGTADDLPPRTPARLPATRWWRIPRATRTDPGGSAAVEETLVDAPFYARSVLRTDLLGERVTAVHESLSLDRFTAPWVQALLPFRMPRAWR